MITNQNFSFQTSIDCTDGESFDCCNFSQQNPHTSVTFTGTGVTILESCNTTNCDFNENVTYTGVSYHTPKSLDEIKADREAEQALIDSMRIYTDAEAIEMLKINGVLPADTSVAKLEDVKPGTIL